jgi:L-alanine-DL-glutamate epimerase-like enolase superfamily enzyme
MRIVDIRETAIPINSTLRNAVFDFSEMTTSVVAVITDVIRDGKLVAGFAFNSTGRYACGAQMRDRFIPRILKAPPESLLDAAGGNLDPEKILACMMQREKPGGHTERSVAIGTIEVAVWDAVAKIAGKPLHAVLAEKYNGGKVSDRVQCYVGGGWYEPGKGLRELQDEIRARLDQGYTTMKIKVGGAPVPEDVERVEAALKVVGSSDRLAVDANAGFNRARCRMRRRCSRTNCAGSRSRPIRSITHCWPMSRRFTMRRSAPARICSRRRMSRTWCASGGCAPTATSSRSTCRSRTASCSLRARWTC